MFDIIAQTTQPVSDLLKITKDVHDFYGSSWNSLIWAVGVCMGIFLALLALIGGLMPWLAERSRERAFKLKEDSLRADIQSGKEALKIVEEKVLKLLGDAQDKLGKDLEETAKRIKGMQTEIDKKVASVRCDLRCSEALSYIKPDAPKLSTLKRFLRVIQAGFDAGSDDNNFSAGLFIAGLFASQVDPKEMAVDEHGLKSLREVIEGLNRLGEKGESVDKLHKLLLNADELAPTGDEKKKQ